LHGQRALIVMGLSTHGSHRPNLRRLLSWTLPRQVAARAGIAAVRRPLPQTELKRVRAEMLLLAQETDKPAAVAAVVAAGVVAEVVHVAREMVRTMLHFLRRPR